MNQLSWIVNQKKREKKLKRTYKIEAWCLDFDEIRVIIEKVWNDRLAGSSLFSLQRKLEKGKKSFVKSGVSNLRKSKNWNGKTFTRTYPTYKTTWCLPEILL